MSKTIHVCLSVRGALKWPKTKLKRLLRDESGAWVSADDARDWLMDQLAMGREVVQLGSKPCEGFDYKTGCPGHEDRT